MAKVIIKRQRFVGCLVKIDVFLGNTYIGSLKPGKTLDVYVNVGSSMLYFKSHRGKSVDTSFFVVVNEKDEEIKLKAKFGCNRNSLRSDFVVEYADNRPHIPMYLDHEAPVVDGNNALPNDSNSVIASKRYGLRCPKCGGYNLTIVSETSTAGSAFDGGNACCGYILFGPIGLLCGLTGKGKQISSSSYWLCCNCGNKFKS